MAASASVPAEERRTRDHDEDQIFAGLPNDLKRSIISLLPSPLLFQCRTLSKDMQTTAALALARRPFMIYQNPSSHCFLLPLDTPSIPLPFSFRVAGEPPFSLSFASASLLCLSRLHQNVLDVCVCSVFCKWKFFLPSILLPGHASHCLQHDPRAVEYTPDADSLGVVFFEAYLPSMKRPAAGVHISSVHAHGAHPQYWQASCEDLLGADGYRGTHDDQGHVDSTDGHVGSNEDALSCHCCGRRHHFRVYIGGTALPDDDNNPSRTPLPGDNKPYKLLLFDSRHEQPWSEHDLSWPVVTARPTDNTATLLATYHPTDNRPTLSGFLHYEDRTCSLKAWLSNTTDYREGRATLRTCTLLPIHRAVLPTDRAVFSAQDGVEVSCVNVDGSDCARERYLHSEQFVKIADDHHHYVTRWVTHSSLHQYGNEDYVILVTDFEILDCDKRQVQRPEFNNITMEEAKKYLCAEDDIADHCTELCPALTPCRLMLYTAYFEPTYTWGITLRVDKAENASALLEVANMLKPPVPSSWYLEGMFLLMEGEDVYPPAYAA